MGKRQPRPQGLAARSAARSAIVATCAGLLLSACGSSQAKSDQPAVDPGEGVDPAETEAAQINAIAEAVNEFGPAVHTCWARAAADDFRLEGQVVLSLELAGDGSGRVQVDSDTTGDAVLHECLLKLWSDYQWPSVFAAGDRIVLPPFEFVAPVAQYTIASADLATYSLHDGKVEVRVLADLANTGNAQASLSLISLSEGVEIPLHSHGSTMLLFVLSGTASLLGVGGPQSLAPGSAALVPQGAVHGLTHTGDSATELVQVYAPGGPEGFYKDQSHMEGTTLFEGALGKKGPRAIVRAASTTTPLPIMAGRGEALLILDPEQTKDASAYLGALRAQPGAVVPPHRHSDSSEYLFVLEGQTVMTIAGQELHVQAGDVVQIPPGIEHSARVTGEEAFKAIQLYAPAGPEQRFKGGSK